MTNESSESPAIVSLRSRDEALTENWYVACLGRELGRRKPLQRTIYDVPYVLFRGADGRAVCMPDRCLHRHAQLSLGTLEDGTLVCPYHGWRYDPSGGVVEVPSEGPEGRRPHPSFCNRPLKLVEQDGCVWIWLGSGEPKTAAPPFRFPKQDDSGWCKYFMITDFDNEVTHLAENFMDVPHTVFVHSGWFRNRAFKEVPITVEVADGSVLVTYRDERDRIGFTSRILNPQGHPMRHTDRFILPNITQVDYDFGNNGFKIISQITPVSTLRCRVYTAIIYRVGFASRLLKAFMRFYTRQVIEQDVKIMANQGANLRRDMKCRFHSTDADVVHASIERLREFARRGDPRAWTQSNRVEKTIWI